ncbi:MAG: DUF1549 domain-containing protein, partial [Gemmataceae bacterium]
MKNVYRFIILACLASMLFTIRVSQSHGEVTQDASRRAEIIGSPTSVEIFPAKVELNSKRAFSQIVISGKYANGQTRDLTHFSSIEIENPKVASLARGGLLSAMADGNTKLKVKVGNKEATADVVVQNYSKADPISFRRDVIAAMNVGGCNMGACHGTPSGKNGFKLSLRGFDPAADYLQLTRDVLARRTEAEEPDQSLMLLKGLGRVPHEGGQRWHIASEATSVVRGWMAEGLKNDSEKLPALKEIKVFPGARLLHSPSAYQQLSVKAIFEDGTSRDVTPLSVFTSSDVAVADVSSSGLVEFKQAGEIAILVRYLEEMVSIRFTYLEKKTNFAWDKLTANNFVDNHVYAKLKLLSIPPSEVCTDQEFLRRAYLDCCGILPTPKETQEYLDSKDPAKRTKLVESLVNRPE